MDPCRIFVFCYQQCYLAVPAATNRFFPTCQVRVVRFDHHCSGCFSSSFSSTSFIVLVLLLHHLCLRFRVHFCLAKSSPISSPPSAQSEHRWTSTGDLPSSVSTAGPQPATFRCCTSTAGPQPGTFRAQWAPLDLRGQMECQKNIGQKDCQNIC